MTYQTEEGSRRLRINTFQQAPDKSNNAAIDASKNLLNASAAPRAQRRPYLAVETRASFCSKRFVLWDGNFILLTYKLAGSATIFVFFTMDLCFDFFFNIKDMNRSIS